MSQHSPVTKEGQLAQHVEPQVEHQRKHDQPAVQIGQRQLQQPLWGAVEGAGEVGDIVGEGQQGEARAECVECNHERTGC